MAHYPPAFLRREKRCEKFLAPVTWRWWLRSRFVVAVFRDRSALPIHPMAAAWPAWQGVDPSTINYADSVWWPNDPNYGVDFGLWSFVPATMDLPHSPRKSTRAIIHSAPAAIF